MNHKILPMANIDLIFNFSSPIFYERRGKRDSTPGKIFFSGLTTEHMVMKQQGRIMLFGASFFPAGFYPFFRIPVSEFKGSTIGLEQILGREALDLEERLQEAKNLLDKLKVLEVFFLSLLDRENFLQSDTESLMRHFFSAGLGIREFCNQCGVHPRTLERLFNRYVGTSPKQFQRLQRFQTALNKLITQPPDSLTTLAHEFEYYDQTHFIKDFKAFTGASPSLFIKEQQSFLQIMKIS